MAGIDDDDDGAIDDAIDAATPTERDQRTTEAAVLALLDAALAAPEPFATRALQRRQHVAFLRAALLSGLPSSYASLDASRPWLLYWIAQALALLGAPLDGAVADRVVDALLRCQSPTGGFGGGPGQLAHLAPTYAAVNALVVLGVERGLRGIDRPALVRWLARLRRPDGSYVMHEDGEVDLRGAYCAVAVASTCDVLRPALVDGTAAWIARCQTYEGGLGGLPGLEAHGGYTFCGLAALHLLGEVRRVHVPRLLHWAARRQMTVEGGFQGRTNKLVDSCYSFWAGALFPLLAAHVGPVAGDDTCLFDRDALQEYLITCCEVPAGGFRDKPGKNRDHYHTCYATSGLSIAQHHYALAADGTCVETGVHVRGHEDNLLTPTDPVLNVPVDRLAAARRLFRSLPPVVD